MDDIDALEPWVKSILNSLDPASRTKLMRQTALALKRANQKRIRKQVAPDGKRWQTRKKSRKVNELEMTYRDKSGKVTQRKVRSVIASKTHLHGHDYLRGAFRSFARSRILEIHSSKTVRRKSEQKMLVGFAKRLRSTGDANGCSVYLSQKDSKIARIHHYGLRQRLGGKNVQYSKRELLGVSGADKQEIANTVLQNITSK